MPSPCSGIGSATLGSNGDWCEWPCGGPNVTEEVTRNAADGCPATFVFDGDFCKPPDGGSRALDEGGTSFVGGSSRGVENEGISELDDGSSGGSPSAFEEAVGLSSRRLAPAEPFISSCVATLSPVSFVLAGGAKELAGRDAGLGGFRDAVARSDVVVKPADIGIGVGVGGGYTCEVDRSSAAGVNAIGGSKRAKVLIAN